MKGRGSPQQQRDVDVVTLEVVVVGDRQGLQITTEGIFQRLEHIWIYHLGRI